MLTRNNLANNLWLILWNKLSRADSLLNFPVFTYSTKGTLKDRQQFGALVVRYFCTEISIFPNYELHDCYVHLTIDKLAGKFIFVFFCYLFFFDKATPWNDNWKAKKFPFLRPQKLIPTIGEQLSKNWGSVDSLRPDIGCFLKHSALYYTFGKDVSFPFFYVQSWIFQVASGKKVILISNWQKEEELLIEISTT